MSIFVGENFIVLHSEDSVCTTSSALQTLPNTDVCVYGETEAHYTGTWTLDELFLLLKLK